MFRWFNLWSQSIVGDVPIVTLTLGCPNCNFSTQVGRPYYLTLKHVKLEPVPSVVGIILELGLNIIGLRIVEMFF